MKKQLFQIKNEKIREKFKKLKRENPENIKEDLKMSFSIWMFGSEELEKSFKRIKEAGYNYVELSGSHHVKELGLDSNKVNKLLDKYDLEVSGVCGLFSPETDLASNDPYKRKNAIEYIRNEIEFTKKVGGDYVIVVPSAVGRPDKIDDNEYERSIATLRMVAKDFIEADIKAAVEPIRSAEVSLIHTIEDVKKYIKDVDHEGIQNINGDIFHMINEEKHIGDSILEAGEKLTNIHIADSNRGPIGEGMINIDIVIMALYLINYNQKGKYVTGEPLGIGGNPYQLMHGKTDPEKLDFLVEKTRKHFKEREKLLTEK